MVIYPYKMSFDEELPLGITLETNKRLYKSTDLNLEEPVKNLKYLNRNVCNEQLSKANQIQYLEAMVIESEFD